MQFLGGGTEDRLAGGTDERFCPRSLFSIMPREVSVELAADIATLIKAQLGCQRLLGRSEKCVLATPPVISNKKQKATTEGLS